MNEVAGVAEQSADARRQRPGRRRADGRDDAPRHGGGRFHQRQAGRAQREGRRHHAGGHDHHEGGGPDQPALAQRGHRGGEGRRVRARLRGRGDRDPPAGRPDGGGHLRHRADGQGNPVGGVGRRDGHGQVLGGSTPRHAGGPAGRRPVVADHSAGAGAGAAVRGRERRDAGAGHRRGADHRRRWRSWATRCTRRWSRCASPTRSSTA